jgi:hypothetical protein
MPLGGRVLEERTNPRCRDDFRKVADSRSWTSAGGREVLGRQAAHRRNRNRTPHRVAGRARPAAAARGDMLPAGFEGPETRAGASAGCGAYTVTFTENGYDSLNSTINAKPEINPLGGTTSGP